MTAAKDLFNQFKISASKIQELPLVGKLLKSRHKSYTERDLDGFRATQRLAYQAAKEIHRLLRPGISEKKAALMLKEYLQDYGVKVFLHEPFVWFGDRTRFDNCKNYLEYFPNKRTLLENEPIILDVAPVLDGYPADIGYSCIYGENANFSKAVKDLKQYRDWLPELFTQNLTGKEIYQEVENRLQSEGYDNIHAKYPLGVLGHRMHPMIDGIVPGILRPFSWQFYWSVLSRGALSETLGDFHSAQLDGLWALEPHLGAEKFGVKFEEMLWVHSGKAEWIVSEGVFCE